MYSAYVCTTHGMYKNAQSDKPDYNPMSKWS